MMKIHLPSATLCSASVLTHSDNNLVSGYGLRIRPNSPRFAPQTSHTRRLFTLHHLSTSTLATTNTPNTGAIFDSIGSTFLHIPSYFPSGVAYRHALIFSGLKSLFIVVSQNTLCLFQEFSGSFASITSFSFSKMRKPNDRKIRRIVREIEKGEGKNLRCQRLLRCRKSPESGFGRCTSAISPLISPKKRYRTASFGSCTAVYLRRKLPEEKIEYTGCFVCDESQTEVFSPRRPIDI